MSSNNHDLEPTGRYYLWGFQDNGELKYPPDDSFESLEDAKAEKKRLLEVRNEYVSIGNYWGKFIS